MARHSSLLDMLPVSSVYRAEGLIPPEQPEFPESVSPEIDYRYPPHKRSPKILGPTPKSRELEREIVRQSRRGASPGGHTPYPRKDFPGRSLDELRRELMREALKTPWEMPENRDPGRYNIGALASAQEGRPSTWAEREPYGGPGMQPGETLQDWLMRQQREYPGARATSFDPRSLFDISTYTGPVGGFLDRLLGGAPPVPEAGRAIPGYGSVLPGLLDMLIRYAGVAI